MEVRAPTESPPGDAEGKAESPGDEASPARNGPDGDVSTDPGAPSLLSLSPKCVVFLPPPRPLPDSPSAPGVVLAQLAIGPFFYE